MEKKSLSNNLKDQNLLQTGRQKASWDCNSQTHEEEDYFGMRFSWPPRCYPCSFCRREFKSAQALGGHMNVHRRDRARLRQPSPDRRDAVGKFPLINLIPNPNPERKFSSSLSSVPSRNLPLPTTRAPSVVSSSLSSLSSPSSASPNNAKNSESSSPRSTQPRKKMGGKSSGFGDHFCGYGTETRCNFINKSDISVSLDLEIGQVRNYEEDLDLELRLGYS